MTIGSVILKITENMSQNQNTNTIIVTGAAGYIGGATCIALKENGYRVIGVDRRKLHKHMEYYVDQFVNECFIHPFSLEHLERNPVAVIHCAGTSLVGPSVEKPSDYFDNNVAKTLKYLDYIRRWAPTVKFVFSSSASVYGEPIGMILTEGSETKPISAYGESKLMTEMMLERFKIAYGLKYVSYRYFNACGAVEGGEHGQEPDATHIFARLFEAALDGKDFTINGADFPTRDGTCVRDYIHVSDIAEAHVLAIDKDIEGIYNIGTLKGHSNLEVFTAVEDFLIDNEAINNKIVCHIDVRREGDPATLIASAEKLLADTGWKPKRKLNDIIESLYDWYNSKYYHRLKQRSSNVIQPAI
jgi:UDP-glucose 4-epimerase